MAYEWLFPLPQNAQYFKKKSVSQSTRIALKRIEMQKKKSPYEWCFPLPQNAQILIQSIGPKFQHSHQV